MKKKRDRCYICGVSTGDDGTSYFRFPSDAEPDRKKLWMKFVNLDPESDTVEPFLRLCHKHFDEQSVNKGKGRHVLSKDAVPTLHRTSSNKMIDGNCDCVTRPRGGARRSHCLICKSSNTGPRLKAHRFPKEIEIRKSWATFCRIGLEKVTPSSRLCQRHFNDTDYVVKRYSQEEERMVLKTSAIPSFAPPPPIPIKKNRKIRCIQCDRNDDDATYFRFPEDELLQKKWLETCDLKDMSSSRALKMLRICSQHFLECDFETRVDGAFILKKNAIPTMRMDITELVRDGYADTLQSNARSESNRTATLQESSQPATSHEINRTITPHESSQAVTSSDVNRPATPHECSQAATPCEPAEVVTPPTHKFRYFGDIKASDVETPRGAKACLKLAREAINSKNDQIRLQRAKINRLEDRVKRLKDRIRQLEGRKK